MANWEEVKETWKTIIEAYEASGMEDYGVPEIYRAAEDEIERLKGAVRDALKDKGE